MRKTTHLTTGISCSIFLSSAAGFHLLPGLLLSIIMSLLPDIDTGYSYINKFLIRTRWFRNNLMRVYYFAISVMLLVAYHFTQDKRFLGFGLLSLLIVFGKHRTFYHSVFMVIPIGMMMTLFGFSTQYVALGIYCYLQHLFLDMFNPMGVMLFYPISKKVYRMPLVVNSKFSIAVEYLLNGAIVLLTTKFLIETIM